MIVKLLLVPAAGETCYSEELWEETFKQSFQRIFAQAEQFGITAVAIGNRYIFEGGVAEEFFLAGESVQAFIDSIKEILV
ncbi:hypothetical protein LR013_00365 [candidate division NPL-UPA2 bacterium]|nr:hypothetical protein [candidate division NPL-UPA2 bacterium]